MATTIRKDYQEPELLPSVIRSIDEPEKDEPEEEERGIFRRLGLKIGRWADRYAAYKLTTGYYNQFRI